MNAREYAEAWSVLMETPEEELRAAILERIGGRHAEALASVSRNRLADAFLFRQTLVEQEQENAANSARRRALKERLVKG